MFVKVVCINSIEQLGVLNKLRNIYYLEKYSYFVYFGMFNFTL